MNLQVSFITQDGSGRFLTLDGLQIVADEPNPSFAMLGERMPFEVPLSPPWGFSVSDNYLIDSQRDYLLRLADEQPGFIFIGGLGFDVQNVNGFSVVANQGWLFTPTSDDESFTHLFAVNLHTGAATELGVFDRPGIVTGAQVVPEPSSLLLCVLFMLICVMAKLK